MLRIIKNGLAISFLGLLLCASPVFAQYGGAGAHGAIRRFLKHANTDIKPSVTGKYNLGSADKQWDGLYVNGITVDSIETGSLVASGDITPSVTGKYNLGSSLLEWDGLYVNGVTADSVTADSLEMAGDIELDTNSLDGNSILGLSFDPDNDDANESIIDVNGNYCTTVSNGICRATLHYNSAGVVTKVDLFHDTNVADYGDENTVGSLEWAQDQLPDDGTEATDGGEIFIHPGDYPFLTQYLNTSTHNVKHIGSGAMTKLTADATLSDNEMIFINQVNKNTFEHIYFYGQGTGAGDAIGVHFIGASSNCNYPLVKSCWFANWGGSYGGLDYSSTQWGIIDGNIFISNRVGFALSGTQHNYGNIVVNNVIRTTTLGGLIIGDFYDTVIDGNVIMDTTNSGIQFTGSYNNIGRNIISNNLIKNAGIYGIFGNFGENASHSFKNSIISNNIFDSGGTFSIWMGEGEDENLIEGNYVDAPIKISGANTVVYNNFGSNDFIQTSAKSTIEQAKFYLQGTAAMANGTTNVKVDYIDASPAGEWSGNDGDVVASTESTSYYREGAACLKVALAAGASANDYVENPLTSGDEDWTDKESVGLWFRSSRHINNTGDIVFTIVDGGAGNTNVNFPGSLQDSVWHWIELDISGVANASKDVITDIRFTFVSDLGAESHYFDFLSKWDADDEVVLTKDIQTDGMLSVYANPVASGTNMAWVAQTEYTDYFINYATGATDNIIPITDESLNCFIMQYVHQ